MKIKDIIRAAPTFFRAAWNWFSHFDTLMSLLGWLGSASALIAAFSAVVGWIVARLASFGPVLSFFLALIAWVLVSVALALNRWVQVGMPAPEEKGSSEPLGTSEESPTEELVFHLQSPTETFDLRIAGAFPGKLGLIEIANPTEAVERLGALLLPTVFRRNDLSHDPIWWFRGHSSQSVETFRDLEGGRCLLNHMELTLRRVVAYRSIDTAHQFVYVKCDPDPPVGLYPHSLRSLEERVAERGYAAEEYGLFRGHTVTRMEYDDAAAVINGKLVDFTKTSDRAEVRRRFLTRFNFVICAKFHPLNRNALDQSMEDILNAILRGGATVEDLVEHIRQLPAHPGDGMHLA